MKHTRRAALNAATVQAIGATGQSGFRDRVAAVPRMVRDTMTGDYDGLPKGRLFAMSLALAYLISPIDLIPEALLTLPGLVDDTAIAVWLLAMLTGSAEEYLARTTPQPVYVTAEVLDDPRFPRH